MEIQKQEQYNQGISRYKLLSASAGVGAIITSTIGNYILIADINKWEFISASNRRIWDIRNDAGRPPEDWYNEAKREIKNNLGVDLVDDQRFIEFLKLDKGLSNLLCLAAIPHLSLNENYNNINVKDNPVIQRLQARGTDRAEESFTIPGTHFPKWFRNDEGLLKEYHKWKEDWKKAGKQLRFFAPPRDVKTPLYGRTIRLNEAGDTMPVFKELTQLNLILICENGHLSDIPWSRYLRWRSTAGAGQKDGSDLFTITQTCCSEPTLKWTENKNRSEGYASVYLECLHCGMGSGLAPDKPKINLEGINNLKPICPGHKPWEMALEEGKDHLPYDANCCDRTGKSSTMQIALVTGNNVYFANTFSSVYMPIDLVTGISEEMEQMLNVCNKRYESVSDPKKTKQAWAEKRIDSDLLDELRILPEDKAAFIQELKQLFIYGVKTAALDEAEDLHEEYRRQEYQVFTGSDHSSKKGLIFNKIDLPKALSTLFTSIKKVEELKVTSVQLDLSRVRPKERVMGPDGKIVVDQGKNIFSAPSDEVFILPAIENFGEGIFFEFNKEQIEDWMQQHEKELITRIANLMPVGAGFNGNTLRQKIKRTQAKLLLVHTFSHLIMRELEFTCGYPTASLKERLYIAPDMAGILIYTAEGSEGSMGGLIWQAQPERILDLIIKALERAVDCSSDPLCWESDGQGVFNLNLAACFSCALVSETACEERNLALDRRILIDDDFGFFTSFIGKN